MILILFSYCPACETRNAGFLPLPDFYADNAKRNGYKYFGKGEMTSLQTYSCKACGASDRERLCAYWLMDQINNNAFNNAKIIHFAPEETLSNKIRALQLFDYKTADLSMPDADYQVDLQNLPFEDDSVDFFICSHVLEHVVNDNQAIGELFRVTRFGGMGIYMAPIIVGLDETIENVDAITEEDRWRYHGQFDHLRLYSHDDFVGKIEAAGFMVRQLGIKNFGRRAFYRMGLKKTSILYLAIKSEPVGAI
jgi:SAM-dependent methyltransferase